MLGPNKAIYGEITRYVKIIVAGVPFEVPDDIPLIRAFQYIQFERGDDLRVGGLDLGYVLEVGYDRQSTGLFAHGFKLGPGAGDDRDPMTEGSEAPGHGRADPAPASRDEDDRWHGLSRGGHALSRVRRHNQPAVRHRSGPRACR